MSLLSSLVLVIVLIHAIGDTTTTSAVLSLGGREWNRFVRKFIKRFGNKRGSLVYLPLEVFILYLVYTAGNNGLTHDFGSAGVGTIIVITSAVLAVVPLGINGRALLKQGRSRPKI